MVYSRRAVMRAELKSGVGLVQVSVLGFRAARALRSTMLELIIFSPRRRSLRDRARLEINPGFRRLRVKTSGSCDTFVGH